ncbi:uncharacterized protein LOC125941253 [Dermacentor silvarum]|uniref:uncharacterized protein LOC125941253 n=1 Tax=Dermacentor silvarum TaxID=543639 RepID=UPI0021015A07|nr:uncharacterized protein LOC125941253 [Dermacentor silvarum]
MVVGLYCKATTGCDKVSEYLKTVYLPDGIVVLGHISYNDNNITGCIMLPTSLYEDSKKATKNWQNLTYMYSMNDAVKTVKHLQQTEGLDTMFAVSTTMAGRWYKPERPDNKNVKYAGRYRPANPCKLESYPQKAHVQAMCGNTTFQYTKNFAYTASRVTGYSWDKTHGFTITFETEETLKVKFCFTFDNHTELLVGVAAYDVNYDAAPKNCTGFIGAAWSRLLFVEKIRKLLNIPGMYSPGVFLSRCVAEVQRRPGR